MFALFATSSLLLQGQSYDLWQTSSFTWEGANSGNKAIWKPDDKSNNYILNGVNVQISLKDSLGLNTTTTNPSEFNDFTKTNTFYGRANLALQIKSQTTRQPVCLEFEFSHPVVLKKFNVFDIDMLQSGTHLPSTYQDSVHFSAFDLNGEVPLTLSYLSASPSYTIYGQSAKANYIAGVNGDIGHTNLSGGVLVTSSLPISKFILCYANGSEDDGNSNSHAIKIMGFEYQEALGRIEGTVYDVDTNLPLAGSELTLVDYNTGNEITNKAGENMKVITTSDGHYIFPLLPLGKYRILQINPLGYTSHSDIDGTNDNIIVADIDVNHPVSLDNDFYEVMFSPLPVKISAIDLYALHNQEYRLSWTAEQELNNDFYEISISHDGINYKTLGKVNAINESHTTYSFDFTLDSKSNKAYVRLAQYDIDGAYTILGVKTIVSKIDGDTFTFAPNPFSENGNIVFNENNENYTSYQIYDALGKIMQTSFIPTGITQHTLHLTDLSDGLYFLVLQGINTTKSLKIVKK
jgi:hypothetical protein